MEKEHFKNIPKILLIMLTEKEVKLLREELATAKNPLFFYDGDGDGMASYLLLYRMHREGKAVALTSTSTLGQQFLRKVDELCPDKIFILDIPIVEQEFIDKAKRPIFWIDHHPPLERTKVKYFNPRLKEPDVYIPTSRMAYQISGNEEDLWFATVGCLSDWNMPDFINRFCKRYPHLLEKKSDLATAVFKSPVGKLVKLFFFILKGPTYDVRRSVKVMSRINSPDEILKQETAQGKFLWKRFERINRMYEELLEDAKKSVGRSRLILYFYTERKWSFTVNLANELAAFYPKKMIIIARKKSGEMKCSLRGKNVQKLLEKALEGVEGGGGGHPDACGAVIKEESWEKFLEQFKEAMKT